MGRKSLPPVHECAWLQSLHETLTKSSPLPDRLRFRSCPHLLRHRLKLNRIDVPNRR